MNSTRFNSTTVYVAEQRHILEIMKLVGSPIGMVISGIQLLALLTHKSIQTPFSIYIGIILLSTTLYATIEFILVVLQALNIYSSTLCYLQQYTQWVISPAWNGAQLEICVNRIWALSFPVSYRQHHTKKLACLIALSVVVVYHVIGLPTVILTTTFLAQTRRCFTDMVAHGRMTLGSMCTAFAPTVVVLTTYPYLLYMFQKRGKQRKTTRNENSGHKEDNHAFLVLTLITVCEATIWTPVFVVFQLAGARVFKVNNPEALQLVAYGFTLVDLIMNPCFIFLSMKDLRRVTLAMVRCRSTTRNVVHSGTSRPAVTGGTTGGKLGIEGTPPPHLA